MPSDWLFLAAYTCSGLAGLIYEVAWTRWLTLHMGHTTAAVSAVVAAFMGGLAAGSALGGRVAIRLTPRQALMGYAALESFVVVAALTMPLELRALTPVLAWAYRDGTAGAFFPLVRLLICFGVLLPPSLALGATFPLAVRWFATGSAHAGQVGGRLYAANTAGAALGALGAGFILIPALGVIGAMLVGVAASAATIAALFVVARRTSSPSESSAAPPRRPARAAALKADAPYPQLWLAGSVVALTGLATFLYEITWTRVFSTVIGPSTYAFAATLTGLITGLAVGSAVGSRLAGRVARPALPLALALGLAAITAGWTSSFAGGAFPRMIVQQFAESRPSFSELLVGHSFLAAALVLPTAICLGVAFPLALEIAGARDQTIARRLGGVYAVNTFASVAGSLAAGFVVIPLFGLQNTLRLSGALLLAGALLVVARGRLARGHRVAGLVPTAIAAALLFRSAPWDRELLAGGAYMYAALAPKDVDLETMLKAGTVVYYREGSTGIVSVKQLTGDLSLAIDGKIDASSSGDMLTQKTLAHLPLLLHGSTRTVCIIGLGSGVTLASALVHPVASVDVIEISPEVVEASRLFAAVNRDALSDRRTRLIIGDGRSHLALSARQYDVIISEPSNPWMAGVAALFTREFFTAVKERLAPHGIICQWAHTYDISDEDLRSVVRTFASVFPNGTMWLIGDADLLLVGSAEPLDGRLPNIQTGWSLPGVAADLRDVSMRRPFALWSLFAGGPKELDAYGRGASLQTDDRMALEFSGPRAINRSRAGSNAAALKRLLDGAERPPTIVNAVASAKAADWRDRGAMMLGVQAYATAFEDYAASVKMDPMDTDALSGFVKTAVGANRQDDALRLLESLAASRPEAVGPRVAVSKLLAMSGRFEEAVAAAEDACRIGPDDPAAFEQLASLYADAGDAARLDPVVDVMERRFPGQSSTRYYAAASSFLQGRLPVALGFARQAIEADPQRASAYNLLGAIHASLGQVEDARPAFQQALRLDRRDSATYTNFGMLELSLGNRSRAADLFAEALSLDPSSAAARQGLARTRLVASR